MTAKTAAVGVIALSLMCAGSGGSTTPRRAARQSLTRLLLGRDVKALIDLPASGEAAEIYFLPSSGKKKTDERGVDMRALARSLRVKGVGIHAGEPAAVTDVRFEKDSVDIQLGVRSAARRLAVQNPLKLRSRPPAGPGSLIKFCYQRPVANADLDPDRFLDFMSRILDVGSIRQKMAEHTLPADFKFAVEHRTVKVGMSYEMVLMAFGDPGQKKINESAADLSETWFYLINGHRWVVDFLDGKVVKVRVY